MLYKKYLTLLLVAFTLFITGCEPPETDEQGRYVCKPNESTSVGTFWYIIFDGHEYVQFMHGNKGGISHSPKCSCRSKGVK